MKRPLRIRQLVLTFSDRAEFWLVFLVAFGFPIWGSLAFTFTAHARQTAVVISDRERLLSSAIQLATFGFVVWIGRVRGWSIRKLGLRPSWRSTAKGIVLFPVIGIVLVGVSVGIHSLAPSSHNHPRDVAIGLTWVGILATIIINPLFEETLVCGYIIERLAKKGAVTAITLSAFIRFLYHTHLGPSSLGPLVMGFMFGYLFWRNRELWPLIIAHSLIDLLGLLLLAGKIL
jgi:membrane protease YdiL (CAAX protease family)